ncbi:hypothetical protein DGG96_15815 [Legionella qingyii]|uniref:Uncharacterized protein n=2 Tax=Legionella qingyii TaxID=2184757 RepID=A0A317TZD5_9GAMM|nr:hypothetical protein DGG96_20560 [Legionella qingyii]PWY54728.1 hypothetical protein DGG96_15815 [Legionella qingyii]
MVAIIDDFVREDLNLSAVVLVTVSNDCCSDTIKGDLHVANIVLDNAINVEVSGERVDSILVGVVLIASGKLNGSATDDFKDAVSFGNNDYVLTTTTG